MVSEFPPLRRYFPTQYNKIAWEEQKWPSPAMAKAIFEPMRFQVVAGTRNLRIPNSVSGLFRIAC